MEISTWNEVKEVVSKTETNQLEFKETTGQLERGMETLCAFLNEEGGTVLYGVTDKGQITGQEVSDQTKRTIADALQRIENGRLPEVTILSDVSTILEKLNLSKNGQLKNAAAVLFAKNNSDYPQCLLRMARFKGVNKDEFIDNQRLQGNIFKLLDAAMTFFFKHLSLSGKINGLIREEELSIPVKALRECCINSLCHRSYNRPGSSVGIAIYDDHIEIENSGTFPSDMNIEKLKSEHRSEPQNPLIADVLYKRKVLENWGRGISLMMDECRRVGLPEPEFHTNGNFVWVVFRYTMQVTDQPTMQATMQATMQPTMQVQKLILSIKDIPLSVKEMMELLSLSNRDYFRLEYLKPALDAGYVAPIHLEQPNHPKQKYYLTEKGKSLVKQK